MREFNIGFVIYPGITQLDFSGPFEVLSRLGTPPSIGVASAFAHARTHVAAKTLQPVVSDRGLATLPDCTFRDCPALDLICVPGGAGVAEAIADDGSPGGANRRLTLMADPPAACGGGGDGSRRRPGRPGFSEEALRGAATISSGACRRRRRTASACRGSRAGLRGPAALLGPPRAAAPALPRRRARRRCRSTSCSSSCSSTPSTRIDVKPLAKALLAAFGDLNGVVAASEHRLLQVPGDDAQGVSAAPHRRGLRAPHGAGAR